MNNCKLLNFPKNILRNDFKLTLNGADFWHVYQDAKNVINDDIISLFKSLNLTPNMIVLFGSVHKIRTLNQIIVHTDLYKKHDQWVKPVCSVNWELGQTDSDIHWFDTSECTEEPIDENAIKKYPNNLFYGKTYLKNEKNTFPTGAKLLESVSLSSTSFPILFRTDIAHGVSYKTNSVPRFMISIRFDIDEIPSWEKAIDIFSEYIL
jgi:hypothetical protein